MQLLNEENAKDVVYVIDTCYWNLFQQYNINF